MAENRLNYGKKISNMGYIAADGLCHGLHCCGAIGKTKNETIKLIINGVEFNADRALVQAVDEPLDSVMKKFHSLEVCQNQTEDNVRGQNPVKYKNWETIGEYLKKNDFNGARNAFGDLQLIDALYHFGLGLGATYNITSDVFVQARYTLGLTKIFKDEDPIKNGNAQIAIGYRF